MIKLNVVNSLLWIRAVIFWGIILGTIGLIIIY
jgi:hypothetical protein